MHRHRSGLLAAWGSAWLAGRVAYDDAVDAVLGGRQHRVYGVPGYPDAVPVGWLLTEWRAAGATRLSVVLPAAGDPRGLPGPGAFTTAALERGAGVRGGPLGVVPGPDTGAVEWTVHGIERPHLGGAAPTPAEADEQLRLALAEAARSLTALDVARWRPEAAGLSSARWDGPPLRLPPGHPPRALGLLERAHRLADVLDLAFADAPGGAVTAGEAGARDASLRPLSAAVRQAIAAAYNA